MPLSQLRTQLLVVWRSGSALVSIDEVNLRRARLVVRRVTVWRFSSWCWTFISVGPLKMQEWKCDTGKIIGLVNAGVSPMEASIPGWYSRKLFGAQQTIDFKWTREKLGIVGNSWWLVAGRSRQRMREMMNIWYSREFCSLPAFGNCISDAEYSSNSSTPTAEQCWRWFMV